MLLVLIVVAVVIATAGCGGTSSGTGRPVPLEPAADGLPDSAVQALKLDRGRARHLGTFRGRGVWLVPTADGDTCLLDTAAEAVGGACGRDLFGAHKLAFTEATEGGPPPRPLTLVRVTGAAAPPVRSVVVELSDGSQELLVPTAGRAFVYDEPPAQVAAGVVPVALVAKDGAAKRVDRIDLPRGPSRP
jgi:hypothetical protein